MQYLYHGSPTQNLTTLEPRKEYTPKEISYKSIYATPLISFAAAHSARWVTKEGFDLDVINGKVVFIVPSELKHRLLIPISIYKVSADKFELTKEESTGYTWNTKEPVKVIEEIKYASVVEAIEQNGGTLSYK